MSVIVSVLLGTLVSLDQGLDNGFDCVVCFAAHFVVGGILDGMAHKDSLGTVHPQGFGLDGSSVSKFFRRDGNRWDPLDFEPYSVVQTARRA